MVALCLLDQTIRRRTAGGAVARPPPATWRIGSDLLHSIAAAGNETDPVDTNGQPPLRTSIKVKGRASTIQKSK